MDIPTQYCEIGNPQYLNVITSFFFIILAFIAYKKTKNIFLPTLLCIIGISSFLWHTTSSSWADLMDTVSIALFCIVVLYYLLSNIFKNKAHTPIFIITITAVSFFLEKVPILNGSLVYIFLLLILLISLVAFSNDVSSTKKSIFYTLLIFFIAILFRIVDPILCKFLITGTHFIWHILVSLTAYRIIMILNSKNTVSTNNEIKMVCFDLDQTLSSSNSWVRLNLDMGITEKEDNEMLNAYKNGTLSYSDWQIKICNLFKERGIANKETITKSLLNFEYNSGARESVKYLRSKGYKLALISGSPDILVEAVAKDLGIEFYNAHNKFIFNDDGSLESLVAGGDEGPAKLEMLKEISLKSGIPLNEIVCIGDGGNEKEIFEVTGRGVTFYGSPLQSIAWKVIDNLHEIKNIF